MAGGWFGARSTVMLNGGSACGDALPSDTAIAMLEYVPADPTGGMPLSSPVLVVNVAQAGLFEMLNVSESPSGSLADGSNA